jgi:mannan endo-1,6-alpha-mannosidase
MSAAEYNFPNPSADEPSWLALAQGVFNSQAARWDPTSCNGGLRWQIFTWNNGYDYKNSPSNGGFFSLAARLVAYTGNQTYADWAERMWDWMKDDVQLISEEYNVYDGTSTGDNCSTIDHVQWTYSAGMILNGCATMWNVTQDPIWQSRAEAVWNTSATVFFNDANVMFEICEPTNNCNLDQQR